MNRPRRVVRKTPDQPAASLDERLWPVQVAIVVLGVFLVGIVLSVCSFTEPRWYRHPLTWFTAVAALISVLMWVATSVRPQFMRRVVMLSLVLSLILNVILLIAMAWAPIFTAPWLDQQQLTTADTPTQPTNVPEYIMAPLPQRNPVKQDFERPVETGSLEAESVAVTRQDLNDRPQNDSPRLSDNLNEAQQLQAHPRRQRRAAASPPRRGESLSLRSRQLVIRAVTPGSQEARQVAASPPQRKAETLQANETSLARTEAQLPAQRVLDGASAQRNDQSVASPSTRRAQDDQPDLTADVPRFLRRIKPPRRVPRTELRAATQQIAQARQTDAEAETPRNTELAESTTAVPELMRLPKRPLDNTPVARPVDHSPSRTATRSSDLASSMQPTPAERRIVTTRPTINTLAASAEQSSSPQLDQEQVLSATSSELTRQPAVALELQRRALPADRLAASPLEQLAQQDRPRSVAEVPAMLEQNQPDSLPMRSRRAAELATSPQAVSHPAVATSDNATPDPSAEPARTALSRGESGIAGVGRSPNLERGANTANSQADLASAHAQRAEDAQATPPGLAILPSLPARQRSTRSGQQSAATSLRVQQVAIGEMRGSDNPAETSVNAAATLERASANAEQAELTAARGETQIDLGPERVVGRQNAQRASGGGQPELNLLTQSRLLTRSRVGGVERISLLADLAAEVAAPAADGSQQPQSLESHASASSLVRTTQGGAAAISLGAASDRAVDAPSIAAISVTGPRQASRAQSIEAPKAMSKSGGGLEKRKVAAPPALAANTAAQKVSVAGADQSAGRENAASITAAGVEIARTSAGELEIPNDLAVGAAADRRVRSAVGPAADVPRARNSLSALAEIAGGSANDDEMASQSPRTARIARPTTARSAQEIEVTLDESLSSNESDAVPTARTSREALVRGDSSKLNQQDEGALVFERDADLGPGGAEQTLTPVVGFDTPRAQLRGELLRMQEARFVRRKIGGPPVASSRAAVTVDAFRHRLIRRGVDEPGGGLPAPPRTEEAIELGLVYLSRQQQADGRWRLSNTGSDDTPDPTPTLSSDTAATGLSLLAFLGAGYHHLEDNYQSNVRAALDYLIENQSDDGNLYVRDDEISSVSVSLYSHGIAALALCEAYGMTQDPWLREPAQKSLDYVASSQHPTLGGWRYTPGVESDTSVSGWMLMALKSGELAELDVPAEGYQRSEQWLNRAQASGSRRHLYRYNPFAPLTEKQRHGRQPTHVMTSVGLLMRMYLGWRRDNQWMQRGAEYLAANPPRAGTSGSAMRDTYYWYYATQVMFHMGGQHWQAWNSQLHPLLVDAQIREGALAGSWNPYGPVPDRWAIHAGRLYVTTMNLLSLEVYYRHLPIYADTVR